MLSLRIALFGTSADPPTEGHKAILIWLRDRFDCVAVWASDNPYKQHQTPLEHRMKMLGVLIDNLPPPRGHIRLYEDLSSPRSLETVRRAREIWGPHAELTFVAGADSIPQMPRWYAAREFLAQVRLLIVPRAGYELRDEHFAALREAGATWEIADLSTPPVSSTAYRERGNTEAIAPPVKDYIHREHLYAWRDAAPPQRPPNSPTSGLGSIT